MMSAGSRIGRTRTPPGVVPAAGQVATTTSFSSGSTAAYTQAGIGLRVTPKGSGSVLVEFAGYLTASATTVNVGILLQLSYGTGTSPAAAAAATGTVVGEPMEFTVGTTLTAAADLHAPIALHSLIQNLTPGVSYWFDIQSKAVTTINITSVNNPVLTVIEQGSGAVIPGASTAGGVPTTQSLTSGASATYTTPLTAKWIEVFMVAAGGGGSGAASGSTTLVAGTGGGNTVFGSITAAGGAGGGTGAVPSASNGGAGGTGGGGSATVRQPGNPGGLPCLFGTVGMGGVGGAGYFGGGGNGTGGVTTSAGTSAGVNTGAGGGGAANATSPAAGGGGGSGEFCYLLITNPAATYTYTIGSGGAGGVSTDNGGAGGSGFIFVIEHYI
jgi:hypothetical protein